MFLELHTFKQEIVDRSFLFEIAVIMETSTSLFPHRFGSHAAAKMLAKQFPGTRSLGKLWTLCGEVLGIEVVGRGGTQNIGTHF